jgi:hypothetical protein
VALHFEKAIGWSKGLRGSRLFRGLISANKASLQQKETGQVMLSGIPPSDRKAAASQFINGHHLLSND